MAVVTGGVSGIVVVVGTGGGLTGWFGAEVPSTPLLGWGGAWPVAPADGASAFVSGGRVMSGGAFW